ncbi:MAG: hypothetical protein K0U20_09465 [Proteobacteria bacterium]|nr:hypothetical protein [Pseudomonadota bacterium]MCH9735754.1 hypothetical protein [Actinomycetes bacterium]
MSTTEVEVLAVKIDILIDDFQAHKKIVYKILGGGITFLLTSIVAVAVAFIH